MWSMSMVGNIARLSNEPPSTPAAALVQKASRLLLLFLCVSPIALFPVALAVRAYAHYFP
jgi:hypothetical protein